jgi:hypothetical protein
MKAKTTILAALVTVGALALSANTAEAGRHYKRYNNGVVVYYGPSAGYYQTGAYRYGRPAYYQPYYRPYYRPSSGISVNVNVR